MARLLDAASRLGSRLPLTRSLMLMSKHSQRTTPRAPSESFTLTCGCSALAALPRANATWDDGVDGALLCYVLFSVHDDPAHGAAMLRFCCSRPVHGQHGSRYHELNTPHDCSLRVRDESSKKVQERSARVSAMCRAGVERCEDIRGHMVMPHRGRMRMAR